MADDLTTPTGILAHAQWAASGPVSEKEIGVAQIASDLYAARAQQAYNLFVLLTGPDQLLLQVADATGIDHTALYAALLRDYVDLLGLTPPA